MTRPPRRQLQFRLARETAYRNGELKGAYGGYSPDTPPLHADYEDAAKR